jgi:hypothetical protein
MMIIGCARAQMSRWSYRVHGVCVELPMPIWEKRGQPESVSEIDFKRVLYSMDKALKMAE